MAKKSLQKRMAEAEAKYAAQCRAAGVRVNDLWKDLYRVFDGKELRDAIIERCEGWERDQRSVRPAKKTRKKRALRGGRTPRSLMMRRVPLTSERPKGPRGRWMVVYSKRVLRLFSPAMLKNIITRQHQRAEAVFRKNPNSAPLVGYLSNPSERESVLVISSAQERITIVRFESESYPKDFPRKN